MYHQWSPLIADEANTFLKFSECDTSIPHESGVFKAVLMYNIRSEVCWHTCGEAEGGMSCFSPVQHRLTAMAAAAAGGGWDELCSALLSFPQHSSDMSDWLDISIASLQGWEHERAEQQHPYLGCSTLPCCYLKALRWGWFYKLSIVNELGIIRAQHFM